MLRRQFAAFSSTSTRALNLIFRRFPHRSKTSNGSITSMTLSRRSYLKVRRVACSQGGPSLISYPLILFSRRARLSPMTELGVDFTELSAEFLSCLDKCPERMRNRVFSCLKSRESTPSSGHRTHLTPSPAQAPHHRADPNAVQRVDPNRSSSRTVHPNHQPDSTTLIADRRRTAPPSQQIQQPPQHQQQQQQQTQSQQQQQQQASNAHGHRISGHHSNSSSDRYAYNKEHQRVSQTQNAAGTTSQGRHSLPANIKPTQAVAAIVHPKKQYQQQHYLGGQQQQQQQQPPPPQQPSQQLQSQQGTIDIKAPRSNNNGAGQSSSHPSLHMGDQSRRPHLKQEMHHHQHHQQQQIHQSNSMPQLNSQLPSKANDMKPQTSMRNQMMGGVLDDASGLLKPADFSQPYPSCASPPAHNPMFEGDSSSMENDFLSGEFHRRDACNAHHHSRGLILNFMSPLSGIVSQASPNNNSGSNSLGFGGSFAHQKQMSPPETQHRLSSPRAYSVGTDSAIGVIPKKDLLPSMAPSYLNVKQEAHPSQNSIATSKTQSAHPQLIKQEIPESSSIHQQLQLPLHGQQQQLPQQPHQQPQQTSLSETAANPSIVRGDVSEASKHHLNLVPKPNVLAPAMNDALSSDTVVVPAAVATVGGAVTDHPTLSRHAFSVQDSLLANVPASQIMPQGHPEINNSQIDNKSFGAPEQTELDGGKKHKVSGTNDEVFRFPACDEFHIFV